MSADTVSQNPQPKVRYFIALIPPTQIQADAIALKHYFREHYNTKAALRSPPHITLQAPFEWDEANRDRLLVSLAQFKPGVEAVPVTLSGFGAFPPRVIYLAVGHTPELMQLQTELSTYLAKTLKIIDPRSRDRPFRPHLTLAFRDLKPAAFRKAWAEFGHREADYAFTANTFTLLRHTGREWIADQDFLLNSGH